METNQKNSTTHFYIPTIILSLTGIIFLFVGLVYKIPDRKIPYTYTEYVGGDAYNIMIEASIRGGEISGAIISKTIYIVVGVLLILSAICYGFATSQKSKHQKTQKDTDPIEIYIDNY